MLNFFKKFLYVKHGVVNCARWITVAFRFLAEVQYPSDDVEIQDMTDPERAGGTIYIQVVFDQK